LLAIPGSSSRLFSPVDQYDWGKPSEAGTWVLRNSDRSNLQGDSVELSISSGVEFPYGFSSLVARDPILRAPVSRQSHVSCALRPQMGDAGRAQGAAHRRPLFVQRAILDGLQSCLSLSGLHLLITSVVDHWGTWAAHLHSAWISIGSSLTEAGHH